MTGRYDDGRSGMFDHLDDPGAPAPSGDVLTSVIHRGRRIRARRQGVFALSGAAVVTAAVLGGLGISHAVDAQRGHDRIVPATTPTPAASASTSPSPGHHPGDSVLVPGAGPAVGGHNPSPAPSTSPGGCGQRPVPTQSPSPEPSGGLPQPVVSPLVPTPSSPPCPSESPSPSQTPGTSQSPSPTESPTATPTPTPT